MIMNGRYLLLFGALVLGVTIADDADTTPLPGDTEADKVVKTLISPGGEIYELLMEVINATYEYILIQKDIWEDFENDKDIFDRNMGKIRTMIINSNSSVKSILIDVYHAAWNNVRDKGWNLEGEAGQIASDLKSVYELFLEHDIPISFKQYDEKFFRSLLDLRIEIRDDFCGCVSTGSYKKLYEEMISLQKRAIGWSVIIQEARRKYFTGEPGRYLRIAGFTAVLAARHAKEFNYRLVHSKLPNLITMITNVKKVIKQMLQLWKKYKIEVDTDKDLSRYYIKRPKDGVSRSPYNIDKLQEETKDVASSRDWLFWERLFYRGYWYDMLTPPTIE
ncbi:unnamed protein product [Owenia fusiformis]|uniref:Uncharacterized protein n=1 Tax=Owenia fusiformis TaxID=6347 RepID=A0A8J1UJH5_OWEFU|nr:unnamed protein product [Owenia fusiformis]